MREYWSRQGTCSQELYFTDLFCEDFLHYLGEELIQFFPWSPWLHEFHLKLNVGIGC